MFTNAASHPTSRWHANDVQATRAMMLTTLSIAAILATLLLARRDMAMVKLAQAALTEIISIRIDDDLSAAAAQRKGDVAPPQRAEASQPDASSLPTRPVDESTATTSHTTTTTASKEVGAPDGTVNGTPDGTATGTPDGVGTQTDGTGTVATDEGDGSDEFIAVEHDPTFSLQDLYRILRYPDMARRAGIEGTVIVKVLVGTTGSIERIGVLSSDHVMLSDAAVDAVQRVQFTPARQNGSAVACWVRIPVRFALR